MLAARSRWLFPIAAVEGGTSARTVPPVSLHQPMCACANLMSAASSPSGRQPNLGRSGGAAALGRPLAAVYGSTSPAFTPPLSEQVEVVRLGLDCSPCFERTCRFGHNNCMRELKPRAVIEALDRLVPQSVEVR